MNYSDQVAEAVQHFWRIRLKQDESQGSITGKRDAGTRTAVTGGAQLDGFIHLLGSILEDAGLPDHTIFKKKTVLPGYFRPTKKWDLVVVADGELLASIELKSHVGPSFGNNFNNRVEEALGSATDIWTAYREGAFKPSQKPWLGWLMLLEDAPQSKSPVRVFAPHFKVFEKFKDASYAVRYELFCEHLVRERLYDATCLLLSGKDTGLNGGYSEPNAEVNFKNFAISLSAHAMAFAKMKS
ncbi:MAG: PaeR7I family type II restriction endonuclease [Proteobacteria bacterium]|nr:restriction endonuclease [Desulfobacula sp.]MBU3952684.1 PaeR7I family type II restriction endonuclease [Pseudomonadota bacterium]MBU4130515.1 PaeR7I family type II restriction endonuclease [Pseudomonadota bacterium]